MSQRTDWLSASRTAQLSMAVNWKTVLGTHASTWKVPPEAVAELDSLIAVSDIALITAQNETTRTPVATAQCRTAFEALTAKMRDLKRRYFLTPPLTKADYAALGLKSHDAIPPLVEPPPRRSWWRPFS
jgi:hypothetical protein